MCTIEANYKKESYSTILLKRNLGDGNSVARQKNDVQLGDVSLTLLSLNDDY